MVDLIIDNEKFLIVFVGNILKKFFFVFLIVKKDNVLCWIELDFFFFVDVLKVSYVELFEFDIGVLDKIKYERVDSYDKYVVSVVEVGEVVVECVYEGDEDEEFLSM